MYKYFLLFSKYDNGPYIERKLQVFFKLMSLIDVSAWTSLPSSLVK